MADLSRERWTIADGPGDPLEPDASTETIEGRLRRGAMTTWFESSRGRRIGLVANGPRAMVLLLDHDGDPGEHAVDPDAGSGSSDGYVLENDQVDAYPDRDTVPVDVAVRVVAHLVSHGAPPGDVGWQVDR